MGLIAVALAVVIAAGCSRSEQDASGTDEPAIGDESPADLGQPASVDQGEVDASPVDEASGDAPRPASSLDGSEGDPAGDAGEEAADVTSADATSAEEAAADTGEAGPAAAAGEPDGGPQTAGRADAPPPPRATPSGLAGAYPPARSGGREVAELRVFATALQARYVDESEWVVLPVREATGDNTYLTAAAVHPRNRSRIVVGTTYEGVFESWDSGQTWIDLGATNRVDALYRGAGFFERVERIAYHPTEENGIVIRMGFGNGAFVADPSTGRHREIADDEALALLRDSVLAPERQVERLDEAAQARRRLAADRTGVYLNRTQMDDEYDAHLASVVEHGMNSIVVDFKDDYGFILYDSKLDIVHEVDAELMLSSDSGWYHPIDVESVIERAHAHGIYVIARVVVFKDREVYRHDENRYALWDGRLGEPWGVYRRYQEEVPVEDESGDDEATDDADSDGEPTDDGDSDGEDAGDEEPAEPRTRTVTRVEQVEYWVDPFSEFVWDYNIAIAKELVELGVDEIQFDYIRTPSDGATSDIVYRFKDGSPALADDDPLVDDRVEALSMFLARARAEIDIPISIDVFGFNAWHEMSFLGQDIAALGQYVDVICPMFYPSHFSRDFMGAMGYLERAEYIYRAGTYRAATIASEHAIIRPYIQSFLIGGETSFAEPTYTDYLKRQIRGSEGGRGSGFTLWNNSGRYWTYMLVRGLYYGEESS